MKVRLNKNLGFTLMELLVAAFLAGIVTFFALDTYMVQHEQYIIQEQVSDMQQRGRAVLDAVAFDLRQSGFNTPDTIIAYRVGLNSVGPDTLEINHHGDNIFYYIDNSDSLHPNLMKSTNGDVQIYADDVTGFELTLLALDLVQVQIVAQSNIRDEMIQGYRQRTYTSRVKIRNL